MFSEVRVNFWVGFFFSIFQIFYNKHVLFLWWESVLGIKGKEKNLNCILLSKDEFLKYSEVSNYKKGIGEKSKALNFRT